MLLTSDMRAEVYFVYFYYFCVQDLGNSIRLIELRAPAHAAENGDALLGCHFDLEGDLLYSVKWYKNDREFYRYSPRNENPAMVFAAPGVNVDLSRSSSDVVTLRRLTAASAGVYRCEVTGEAPLFATVADQKYIGIHLLPETGPRISSFNKHFNVGDRAILNCSSMPSRPETQLKWWINEVLAPRKDLQGPWYRVAVDRPDATETILQLRLTITEQHFRDGVLKIKCQATVAPLYQEEAVELITQEDIPEPAVDENRAFAPDDFNLVNAFEMTTVSVLWPIVEENGSTMNQQFHILWIVLLPILLI